MNTTFFKRTRKPSPLERALNPIKPLDRPLTQTERWVVYVLINPTKGERPDEATETLINNTISESPSQWTKTAERHPEIVEAIHSYIYGNLCERATGTKSK